MATVLHDDVLHLPLSAATLAGFRAWSRSSAFPLQGRFDFIGDQIEVDMAPEDLFCHGTLKSEIHTQINAVVRPARLGALFCDRTRVVAPVAELSVEPDIVFVSRAGILSRRVTLIPKASREEGRFVEIEGAPDLIVEIVSDSSAEKDLIRLPVAYAKAGVQEYWIIDARGDDIQFTILAHDGRTYAGVEPDADGYTWSEVLKHRFRLARLPDDVFPWQYELSFRP